MSSELRWERGCFGGSRVTPRGAGSGQSGGCVPEENGIVISLTRMNQIRSIEAFIVDALETERTTEEAIALVSRERGLPYHRLNLTRLLVPRAEVPRAVHLLEEEFRNLAVLRLRSQIGVVAAESIRLETLQGDLVVLLRRCHHRYVISYESRVHS